MNEAGRWCALSLACVTLAVSGPVVPVNAQLPANTGVTIPRPVGLVNDFANVLSPQASAHIEQIASDVRQKSRGEITVVTLPNIDDRAPADVALQIGREWKVGKIGAPGDPTRNAGAVILVVPKNASAGIRGQCFIATGNGSEGFITDADAGDMCREVIPYFRDGDYSDGIDRLTYLTAQRFADEFHFSIDTSIANAERPQQQVYVQRGLSPFGLLLLVFVVFMILSALARRGGGPRGCLPIILPFGGWGGGGWSGGGGWGGGGGFGGGGGGGGFGGFGGGGGFSGGGGGSSW